MFVFASNKVLTFYTYPDLNEYLSKVSGEVTALALKDNLIIAAITGYHT